MKVCKINMRDVKGKCMLLDCECSEEKCSKWKSLTNYDNIKAMSVEELADVLYDATDKICFENCSSTTGNKVSCPFRENVDISDFKKCI